MSEHTSSGTTRRTFLQNTGRVAAAGALASMVVPKVHAAEDNTIRNRARSGAADAAAARPTTR